MNKEIEQLFKDFKIKNKKIPVSHFKYDGHEDTYIVYMQTDSQEGYSADDKIGGIKVFYDFDVYSKTNYKDILEKVTKILEDNNWYHQINNDYEEYEEDTKFYHKTLAFSYLIQNK